MSLTISALKAFREKGYSVSSRLSKKDRRKPESLKHAVFSGYIKQIDDFAASVIKFVEKGCLVQTEAIKGYVFMSYPESEPRVLDDFKHELYETGNHLRFIGYSDKLVMGGF